MPASPTIHNPDRYMIDLRQILSQGRKRIGILIGAGAPTAIQVDEHNQLVDCGAPLIPDVAGLTAAVVAGLDETDRKVVEVLKHEIDAAGSLVNIETILTQISRLAQAIGTSTVHGFTGPSFDELGRRAWDDTHKRADHGPLHTGSAVLQVLGYRWPEEQDAERELAAKQRERVQPCEALDGLADEDGIIWISSFRDTSNGVRLSIRPFMAEVIPGGRRGVGILRSKPNIHWRKDRGRETRKEADRFTRFWSNGKLTGDRVNDVHLSSKRKRSAKCPAGAQ